MAEVVITPPGFLTPRIVMQVWVASITTVTPLGSNALEIRSAICLVNRSCTCGLFAKWSTALANLESPTILLPGR